MATSSIFASFDIHDKALAQRFADALERCEAASEWKPSNRAPQLLTDKSALRALIARKKEKGEDSH